MVLNSERAIAKPPAHLLLLMREPIACPALVHREIQQYGREGGRERVWGDGSTILPLLQLQFYCEVCVALVATRLSYP